jgi:hypothetical protein
MDRRSYEIRYQNTPGEILTPDPCFEGRDKTLLRSTEFGGVYLFLLETAF